MAFLSRADLVNFLPPRSDIYFENRSVAETAKFFCDKIMFQIMSECQEGKEIKPRFDFAVIGYGSAIRSAMPKIQIEELPISVTRLPETWIKKNNVLFDLIKMDWIDGKTLEYFMITCKNKNEIKIIKEKFKKTIEDMEQYGIAHGDLHPKNIMIDKNSEIKLVDYDCMYVEDFKGSSMPELGDLDTQHPNRASFKYDSTIDRFSALVLYLALMVIEEDPNFSNIRNGDFIFKKEDYEDPHNSNTFKKLKMLSEDVNYILKILIAYCEQKNPKIDTLSSILERA